jgi:multicomponent Na+:H+ antiporter subunit G
MLLTGAVLTLAGAVFLFLGSLGLIRMPDLYNRMQTGTKTSTLGSLLFLIGIAVGFGFRIFLAKVIILILFILITNPISSHALARAAHFTGIKLTDSTVRDNLKEDEEGDK